MSYFTISFLLIFPLFFSFFFLFVCQSSRNTTCKPPMRTGSATVHCKYARKRACAEGWNCDAHAQAHAPIAYIGSTRASTSGKHPLGPCQCSSNPRQPPPFIPGTFTEEIPSTTRIYPPDEPLNQYSSFSGDQERYPPSLARRTNFWHVDEFLLSRFLPKRDILLHPVTLIVLSRIKRYEFIEFCFLRIFSFGLRALKKLDIDQ